jgi:hypothetical protein
LQLALAIEMAYGPCVWLIKLSLFTLLLELFGRLRWMRFMAILGITVTGLIYGAVVVLFGLMCLPREAAEPSQWPYRRAMESAKCTRIRPLIRIVVSLVSITSDLYLIILPLPPVWSLRLPLRKKWAVSTIFLTGLMSDLSPLQAQASFR